MIDIGMKKGVVLGVVGLFVVHLPCVAVSTPLINVVNYNISRRDTGIQLHNLHYH